MSDISPPTSLSTSSSSSPKRPTAYKCIGTTHSYDSENIQFQQYESALEHDTNCHIIEKKILKEEAIPVLYCGRCPFMFENGGTDVAVVCDMCNRICCISCMTFHETSALCPTCKILRLLPLFPDDI
jgi:hypothetical protein